MEPHQQPTLYEAMDRMAVFLLNEVCVPDLHLQLQSMSDILEMGKGNIEAIIAHLRAQDSAASTFDTSSNLSHSKSVFPPESSVRRYNTHLNHMVNEYMIPALADEAEKSEPRPLLPQLRPVRDSFSPQEAIYVFTFNAFTFNNFPHNYDFAPAIFEGIQGNEMVCKLTNDRRTKRVLPQSPSVISTSDMEYFSSHPDYAKIWLRLSGEVDNEVKMAFCELVGIPLNIMK